MWASFLVDLLGYLLKLEYGPTCTSSKMKNLHEYLEEIKVLNKPNKNTLLSI